MFAGLRASWKINNRREGWVGRVMLLVPVLIARLDLWGCWGCWVRVESSDVSISGSFAVVVWCGVL